MSITAAAAAAPTDSSQGIVSLFCQLRDHMQHENQTGIQTTLQSLSETYQPAGAMRVLAPFLIRDDHQPDSVRNSTEQQSSSFLSRSDALSVMGLLVGSDPNRYLIPISVAVKQEMVQWASTSEPMRIMISPELLQVMVSQLSGTNVEVAENATLALVAACRKLGPAFGVSAVQGIYASWQHAWEQLTTAATTAVVSFASTVSVRCASAMVEIGLVDDALMKVVLSSDGNAANVWIPMLQYQADPLLQLSVLDLMDKLVTTTRPWHVTRLQWLFSNHPGGGLIKTVLHMAGGYDGGVPDPILGGSALRVVAAFCKLLQINSSGGAEEMSSPLLVSENHHLLTGFHQALHNWEGGGDVDRLAIVDAISSFASASDEALEMILDDPVTRSHWLSLAVAQTKLKAAILVSVARVLDPSSHHNSVHGDESIMTDSADARRPSNAVGMKLYAAVGQTNDQQDTTGLLLSMSKSPLPEVRLGCYALIEAVAKLPTGGQILLLHGDFFSFLTVRENESTKNGREAKYAIVQAILASPVKTLLADDIVRQLEKYIDQGPHYSKALSWELATD